jgi:hypothetical protein
MLSKISYSLALVVALVFAGTAVAGQTSSSSIAGPYLVAGSTNAPAGPSDSAITPQFGDTITFDVSTTATSNPFVNVNCYQDGVLVMNSWSAFFPGGARQDFGLYSPSWQSGGASCTADLGMLARNGKWKVLASTTFQVSA